MKEFRRVDMWMLGKSLLRLLLRIQRSEIVRSVYFWKLREMIFREVMRAKFNRIKIGAFKK